MKNTEEKTCKISISELKQHPYNEKIYGVNEDVTELTNSILEHGLKEPLIINKAIKEQYGVISNGYPFIIIRKSETRENINN